MDDQLDHAGNKIHAEADKAQEMLRSSQIGILELMWIVGSSMAMFVGMIAFMGATKILNIF